MNLADEFHSVISDIYNRIDNALNAPSATHPNGDTALLASARRRILKLRVLVLRMPEEMQTELVRARYSSHADLSAMIDSLEASIIEAESGGRGLEFLPIDLAEESGNAWPILAEDQ